MKKVKCITASIMVTVYFFAFIFLSPFIGLQQVSAQNTDANGSAAVATDIVSNNDTLNLSNNTLSLQKETIAYDNSQGYLVYPSNTINNDTASITSATSNNKLPAVVMIHEWWGLNDNTRIWPTN